MIIQITCSANIIEAMGVVQGILELELEG